MSFHYCILGAGRQGVALAYDLIRNGAAARVTLVDLDHAAAQRGAERLRALLPDCGARIDPVAADISDAAAARRAMAGAGVVVSAAPYRLNAALTDAAIAAGASFCDLGGNTDVVRAQLARDAAARAAGVSVVPDCGLAPGLGNHLAAHGIGRFDEPEHVHIRCGGLPQERVGPLQYKLVFNFDGLINEYSGFGEFLRAGELARVPALTELEEIEFDPPLGRCEAAVTSGGTSTCPQTFLGRLQTYDYKTVRYPGHFAIIRALFELGCFEDTLTVPGGQAVSPRALLRQLFEQRLSFPSVRDLVVLRTTVIGRRNGTRRRVQYDLFDRHDPATGFTAMERTTAFPAALVAFMQARGLIEPGARPLEIAVPADRYVAELPQHDIRIRVQESPAAG
jgi:lysine 6-dehydrogenase